MVKVAKKIGKAIAKGVKKLIYKYDMLKDGVTTSMIKKWRDDRESARLSYIEGWYNPVSSLALMYGTASHWCLEQIYHRGKLPWSDEKIRLLIKEYDEWYREHRGRGPWLAAETDNHQRTLGLLSAVMPAYMRRICMKDSLYNDCKREWVSLETTFEIPIEISVLAIIDCPDKKSGKPEYAHMNVTIPVRGRIDGVFRYKGKLWVLETKNLSMIDEDGIMQKLPRDLQSNIYITAVRKKFPKEKVGGILYNIMRRPGLRLGKTETEAELIKRVVKHIKEKPDHYFMRFEAAISQKEQDAFVEKRLKPTLISMYEWWEDVTLNDGRRLHYDNDEALLTKYGHSPYFHAITKGDYSSLRKRSVVFSELEEI